MATWGSQCPAPTLAPRASLRVTSQSHCRPSHTPLRTRTRHTPPSGSPRPAARDRRMDEAGVYHLWAEGSSLAP